MDSLTDMELLVILLKQIAECPHCHPCAELARSYLFNYLGQTPANEIPLI